MTLAAAAGEPQGLAGRLAFSPEEACQVLGISRSTIRTLMSTGRLRYVNAERRVLIPRSAIEEFLSRTPERAINRPGYPVRRSGR